MIPASSLVGDEIDSRFSDSASGLGNSVKFTLFSISSGRSLFFTGVLHSLFVPDVPSIFINGLAANFMIVIS